MELLKCNIDNLSLMTPIIFVEDSVYNRYTSQFLGNSTIKDELKTCNDSTIKDELKTCNESTIKDELKTCNDSTIKDELKTCNDFLNISNSIRICNDVNEKLNPVEFLKVSLNMVNCENSKVVDMMYKFCEDEKVLHKFKRKNVSMMIEGIANNKWNVNVCNLFNFLLHRNFIYRNKIIGESNMNAYKI